MTTARTGPFEFLVSTLPGNPDVALLRAAARAGASAILNLEAVRDVETAVTGLLHPKAGVIGLRLDSWKPVDVLGPGLLAGIDILVLTPGVLRHGSRVIADWHSAGRRLLVECTSFEDASLAAGHQVDGLIAKGHESGGHVGEETTFVLVQRLLGASTLPVWAHGGISTHTVAACHVAGCAGAVIDAQLLLARESSAPEPVKAALERMAGDETICLGSELGAPYRVYRRPGFEAVQELQRIDADLQQHDQTDPVVRDRWRAAIEQRIDWSRGPASVWPIGQDGAFASTLASRYRSVPGILHALQRSLADHVESARRADALAAGSPLATSHGTRHPVLQGPMTRVSDTVDFADAVADGGALPFLALALSRGPQVRALLRDTKERLGQRPWGVGILGFVPLELREEQLAAIEEFRPPFALIAGGRPDQARRLEDLGVTTYLHVPAPSLLQMFIGNGARRFVFEGRECGGHVGPRTSFVLWQLMVDTLLDAIASGLAAEDLHAVFAGGIHDARSAAMVAALSAPLSEAGVRVGILIGTAYLFTQEAVRSGAILDTFQQEALSCTRTVLLESGPGHATRCADTAFGRTFRQVRRALHEQGRTPEDIRLELEALNLGRLRLASKGIKRQGDADGQAGYASADDREQRRDGMYMIGQVAALRDRVCRIADLHHDVSAGATELLHAVPAPMSPRAAATPHVPTAAATPARVAIVGMGCLLPNAPDVRSVWHNVLTGVDAIREVPRERFDAARYYDPDRRARDRIYSKWGGFLDEVPFDPLEHGIPPSAMRSIDPFQLLTLEVVAQALRDAGYADRPFNRDRTSVILGASGGVGDLGFRYGVRAGLPMFLDHVPEETLAKLPQWTEDSFAGVLLNVAAGRVANRLDLGGLNFTVDAACASSLAAAFLATRELESGSSDMVLIGGIDTVNSPFGYLCFSSAQALSPSGRCRTFDEQADGIVISEGLVVLVLKRLADAERDGDRIYAVIRGVAGSSDGRGKGLTAPRPEGQARVLDRAYAAAGVSPATVGLIEAHGTGTVAGDGAEIAALSRVFTAAGAPAQACAIGSIKSMIGHTKSAAGVSGLLKAALALHHKVLPPTLHVTKPNPRLSEADSPFYVNTEARPWIAPAPDRPRRAGVSSFGFGGTNFHVVLEEYAVQAPFEVPSGATDAIWPAELVAWSAGSTGDLLAQIGRLEDQLCRAPGIDLRTAAATVGRGAVGANGPARLAVVAASTADLREKLAAVRATVGTGRTSLDKDGVFLETTVTSRPGVAFLYPGQGSQYPGMFRELALHFPDVRHALEAADRLTRGHFPRPLSSYVMPPPAFSPTDAAARMRELTDTSIAQPALGAVEAGLCRLFERLGITPDVTAGHSYGEYVALHTAGALSFETLVALSAGRGRVINEAARDGGGAMAAVGAPPDIIERVLGPDAGVTVANLNAPRQTVIAGTADAIDRAIERLSGAGTLARRLPVACAFHSPLVEPAQQALARLLTDASITPPRVPVFSNSLAAPYPDDPEAIRNILSGHLVQPVRFVEQVEAMYAAGARVFLELGPRGVLTNLVRETLGGRPALASTLDVPDRHDVVQVLTVLAQLHVAGIPVNFDALWRGREIPAVRLDELSTAAPAAPPAHAWMVSGGRARPLKEAAPVAERVETPPVPRAVQQPASPARAATARVPEPLPGPDVEQRMPLQVTGPARPAHTSTVRRQADAHSNGGSMSMTVESLPQAAHSAGGSDAVMRHFHQLMSQFLQTQALVMTAYLQGAARGLPAHHVAAEGPVPAFGETFHPPVGPLVAMPQGWSTVASGPIDGASRRNGGHHPAPDAAPAPQVAAAPPAPPPVTLAAREPAPVEATAASAAPAATAAPAVTDLRDGTGVLRQLLRIVSERTGYPEEMLKVDANIEADLGIDSIKRMEILAAFQQAHASSRSADFQQALEKLTSLKTLRESAATIAELLGVPSEAALA